MEKIMCRRFRAVPLTTGGYIFSHKINKFHLNNVTLITPRKQEIRQNGLDAAGTIKLPQR
jgi:hypothetical protein